MRNYIKTKEESSVFGVELSGVQKFKPFRFKRVKRAVFLLLAILVAVPFFFSAKQSDIAIVELSEDSLLKMATAPVAATGSAARGTINVPTGTVKLNPFVPYRNIDTIVNTDNDVPTYTLVEPPEEVAEGSDAARVMDTIVSGILYDKYSPSAIINIEGMDYLVKKGDVVNNYKVLCIAQDSVTVKLGENTYKAGIGEILTEGTLNHNDVSNLNNKFGGAREWVTVI